MTGAACGVGTGSVLPSAAEQRLQASDSESEGGHVSADVTGVAGVIMVM